MKNLKKPVVEEINDLPTLPAVVTKLLELILHEDPSVREVSDVIKSDQALSGRILKIVNSVSFGISEDVTSIQHAVALLGINSIKKLVLSVSVYDSLLSNMGSGGVNKEHFWQHCLATAAASRSIAEKWDFPTDQAYAAGLFHDVGKIIFDLLDEFDYKLVVDAAVEGNRGVLESEQAIFQKDHTEIGAKILDQWGFPDELVSSVLHHHADYETLESLPDKFRTLSTIVQTADFICWTQGFGSVEISIPPHIDARLQKEINLEDFPVVDVTEEVTEEIKKMADVFQYEIPSANRFQKALQKANLELGRLNSLYEEARNQLEQRIRELTNLNKTLQETRGTLDSDQVLQKILDACRSGLSFDRSFYFQKEEKTETLSIIASSDDAMGNSKPPPITLSYANRKTQLKKLKSSGTEIYDRFTPNELAHEIREELTVNEIVLSPVTVRGELHGFLVADHRYSELPQDKERLNSFEILASEAGIALENSSLFEQAKKQAITDDLTGLNNRRHCLEMLEQELTRAKRYNRSLSVAMLDLDNFKDLNDNYGHLAGDQILKKVASCLKKITREVDIIGRYGGEEFLIILPETGEEESKKYGERIREEVENLGEQIKDEFPDYKMTISIGMTELENEQIDDPEVLIQEADEALYRAKHAGRNKVVVS